MQNTLPKFFIHNVETVLQCNIYLKHWFEPCPRIDTPISISLVQPDIRLSP